MICPVQLGFFVQPRFQFMSSMFLSFARLSSPLFRIQSSLSKLLLVPASLRRPSFFRHSHVSLPGSSCRRLHRTHTVSIRSITSTRIHEPAVVDGHMISSRSSRRACHAYPTPDMSMSWSLYEQSCSTKSHYLNALVSRLSVVRRSMRYNAYDREMHIHDTTIGIPSSWYAHLSTSCCGSAYVKLALPVHLKYITRNRPVHEEANIPLFYRHT